MDRRLVSGLALAAGLAVAACTDQPQEQSLQEQSSVGSFVTPCNTNSFNSLIAGYFAGDQQQLVKDYKDAMLAALPNDTLTAQTNGFNILREIALAAKGSPQPPAATGSALAVETLRCIVEVTDTNVIKPASPALSFFTNSLNHDAGGGFEVRGGSGDPTVAVQADSGTSPKVIAGIAPPKDSTWAAALDGQRVLFYGEPGTTAGSYHWSVVRRNATFDPPLVVTTCVDDASFGQDANSAMLTEENVGVLAFVDASYIGCGLTPATASAGRFDLLRHLASLGRKLFTPEPAAAAAVMPGLVGGSAKGVKSHFDVHLVQDLDVRPDPTRVNSLVVNTGTFDLTVTVRDEDDRLVNGATVELSTGTNSGAFNFIHEQQSNGTCSGGTPTKVTGAGDFPTGTVTFHKLCITQTGYVTVFINVGFAERSGTGSASIPRIKVTPPPKK
jgi:hypothetical protein